MGNTGDVNREQAFGETLLKLRRTAREQGGTISAEQIREMLAPFDLDEKQMGEVYAYLQESHIGVDEAAPDAEEYLSEKERDYLAEYLKSLEELPERTDRERLRLAKDAIAGDEDAAAKLAESMLVTVADIARLYVQQGVYLEDLIGEGNVALYNGVSLLGALEDAAEAEPTLTRYIMDAMEAFIAENLQEDARGQRAVNRVNEVADRAKELYEDLRRPVTVDELMKETGWSKDKILEAWKLAGGAIEELTVTKEDLEGAGE